MINQSTLQRQHLNINPQQIQLLNFFALTTQELEQRTQTVLDENPFLEYTDDPETENQEIKKEDVQDYCDWDEYGDEEMLATKHDYANSLIKEDIAGKPLAAHIDFKEDARRQLRWIETDPKKLELAEYIIDSLNDKGFLERTIEELTEDYSFRGQHYVEVSYVKNVLEIVKKLEPIGLGTSNIRECLLIQLKEKKEKSRLLKIAIKLVESYYDELIKHQFNKIHHALNINDEELHSILAIIGKLKFYPVFESTSEIEPRQTIIPDYIISRIGDTIEINLYNTKSDRIFINHSLFEQFNNTNTKNKSSLQYAKNKLQSATWFINSVKQREATMLIVMRCIVLLQQNYFMDGDELQLKPMGIRHVAEITKLDFSTISRITANKYADTHFGPIYLKNLFSWGVSDQNGETISNKVIKSKIEEAIKNENKNEPYSDQQLVRILSSQGYNIARRTISKYRDLMKIPTAQYRGIM